MNRQLVLSLGLLATSIVAVMPGCSDDDASGATDNNAGESSSAGQSNAGQSAGGTGGVVVPQGGDGGIAQVSGGAGGVASVEGGASPGGAGAGGANVGEGGTANDCALHASYGNLGAVEGLVSEDQYGVGWQAELQAAAPHEGTVMVELYPPFPPFEEGVTTVTNHVLTGEDLDFASCGICVRLVDRVPVGNSYVDRHYFVTGGTVSLTSVEGRFTGSASNLTFEEVTYDAETGDTTPVPGGCESSIGAVSFDDAFAQGGAGGAGG